MTNTMRCMPFYKWYALNALYWIQCNDCKLILSIKCNECFVWLLYNVINSYRSLASSCDFSYLYIVFRFLNLCRFYFYPLPPPSPPRPKGTGIYDPTYRGLIIILILLDHMLLKIYMHSFVLRHICAIFNRIYILFSTYFIEN